jgi:hypothetical protein
MRKKSFIPHFFTGEAVPKLQFLGQAQVFFRFANTRVSFLYAWEGRGVKFLNMNK